MERRLIALLSRVEQGRVVTNLQLHIDDVWQGPETDRFKIRFGELLTRSSGLKSLTLVDVHGTLFDWPNGIFPFHLVELHIHFSITPEHWDLIFAQPTIRRLGLNLPMRDYMASPYFPTNIPTNALPQLEALSAHLDIVEKLLPGRPVKYVATTLHYPSGFERLGRLVKKSTAPLTALSVGLHHEPEAWLRMLLYRTPSLRFLEIYNLPCYLIDLHPVIDSAPLRSLEMLECGVCSVGLMLCHSH